MSDYQQSMETFEGRLKRFLSGSPHEVFGTILNSISNFTLRELRKASEAKLYNLAMLGAHAVMQTIGEQIYDKKGVEGTTFYLKNFVDGDTDGTRFSEIAQELHTFRNVHAHHWSSRCSHNVGLDTSKEDGWWRDVDGLHINPVVFMAYFLAGFKARGPMWTKFREFNELTAIRRKYAYLKQWLRFEKDHEIPKAIQTLYTPASLDTVKTKEKAVQDIIMAHFGFKTGVA